MTSAFDAPTTEQGEAQTTGQDDTQNTTEDWLERVVAEKGDHWKDPATLAKGYAHSQQRIKELEALAEKYKEQDYAKQLLEQLKGKQAQDAPPTAPAVTNQEGTETQDATSLTSEDIERLLESKLSERSKTEKVEQALRSKFGAEANRIVHRRAEELGLSIDKMKSLAMDSPDAFLRLIGEPESKQTNRSVSSTVNTTSGFNSNGGERDSKYYTKLRRENRRLYNSSTIQTQMIEDRKRLGDKYYT